MKWTICVAPALSLVAACTDSAAPPSQTNEATVAAGDPPATSGEISGQADALSADSAEASHSTGPLAAQMVRQEWAKAVNSSECAPIVLTTDGGAPATARPAMFSGGWSVAFDMPGQRSAYGIAGPGLIPVDRTGPEAQIQRLMAQWPYFRQLPDLPQTSFAGYGVVGGSEYPADNPDGHGLQSLAYLRIGGQTCTYNVWSELGREHLEALLDSIRML